MSLFPYLLIIVHKQDFLILNTLLAFSSPNRVNESLSFENVTRVLITHVRPLLYALLLFSSLVTHSRFVMLLFSLLQSIWSIVS